MSRIAGLHRPADPRPADDCATVRRMLLRYAGAVEILDGPQGALGCITRSGGSSGGIADACGLRVALDGRILNAAELRAALSEAGIGDAALIGALVRRYGMSGALARLSGDFAVAVLDPADGTLWLGRDRFGVKPLYWTSIPGGIAFASQPRSLLMLSGVSAEPDSSFVARFAASHYRTFDNDLEKSPYRMIRQLPAATVLAVGRGGVGSPVRYWQLEDRGDLTHPEAELAEAYRSHMRRAVGQRVSPAPRPLFTLSGGLDSSSVLYTAVDLIGEPQEAVSCLYTDHIYDERTEVRDAISSKVAAWHAVEIGNNIDVASLVARQVRLHDEPVATATWLSHLLLVEHVSELGFSALFGGLGVPRIDHPTPFIVAPIACRLRRDLLATRPTDPHRDTRRILVGYRSAGRLREGNRRLAFAQCVHGVVMEPGRGNESVLESIHKVLVTGASGFIGQHLRPLRRSADRTHDTTRRRKQV
jgi:asparagine synthase (glutamine-hydrolysing)